MNGSVENAKRVVVEGLWDGNVIPVDMQEWRREVFIRAGAVLNGSVFGDLITISGPETYIRRAVYAQREVQVRGGRVLFQSSVGAGVAILAQDKARTRIVGDVVAPMVTLENCDVRGSVHGETVRLDGCTVLGKVRSRGLLECQRSLLLTADAEEITFGADCGLLLPYARATRTIHMQDTVGLAFAHDVSERLREEDLTERDGGVHLVAGRRLTEMGKERIRRNLEALLGLLVVWDSGKSAAVGGSVPEAALLPPALREWLTPWPVPQW